MQGGALHDGRQIYPISTTRLPCVNLPAVQPCLDGLPRKFACGDGLFDFNPTFGLGRVVADAESGFKHAHALDKPGDN
jgi:hypothetical protein